MYPPFPRKINQIPPPFKKKIKFFFRENPKSPPEMRESLGMIW